MYFRLRLDKLVDAVGVLFRAENKDRMNYMRLLKLLYFADREFLRLAARPIVGGRVIAMERGPVLEEVYDLIRDQHTDLPRWTRFFATDHYDLRMVRKPGVDALSRREVEILQKVSTRHQDMDEWEIVEEAHRLPEWRKHNPGRSSCPIPLADILGAVGRGQEARAIFRTIQEEAVLDGTA